jgi:hypothetical protein
VPASARKFREVFVYSEEIASGPKKRLFGFWHESTPHPTISQRLPDDSNIKIVGTKSYL